EKSKDTYRREMDAIDEFLSQKDPDMNTLNVFVEAQRAILSPDVVRRSRRVAAVLVEPIQGEGGVRLASARFMRKLRLLTRIYDVPLVFDEVQTGWGMTGRLWGHELFDLPCPPDVVTWAKQAQNGALCVSEALATLLPAGERVLRFYPRYDSEPSAIDEALSILRLAVEDLVGGRVTADASAAPEIRVGTLAIPLDTVEIVDLTPDTFQAYKLQVLAV